jgi:hypothetical protein
MSTIVKTLHEAESSERRLGVTPDGYPVSSYCTTCGRDFAADTYFDRHRIGRHAYTFSEGLKLDPPREDGRRCMDDDELRAAGLRPMSDAEQRASRRHACRAGYGVELWHDPTASERLRSEYPARRPGSSWRRPGVRHDRAA